MKIGAFLIARMSSTRLPGKSMMKILGQPMIALMAERVKASKRLDEVVITTSEETSDDPLAAFAGKTIIFVAIKKSKKFIKKLNVVRFRTVATRR